MNDDKTGKEDGDQTGGGAGSGDGKGEGGGGAADPLSRRQFLQELSSSQVAGQTPAEGELTDDQIRDIQTATKDFIEGVEMDFEDMLPDATRSQQQEYARAALESDHAAMIKVILDSHKVTTEKADQERRESADDLNIQRTGSGQQGGQPQINSMQGAMAVAARGLRGN